MPTEFFDFLKIPAAAELDEIIKDERQSSALLKMDDPEVALKVMESSLWYSYMFNRFTIPKFASHVFQTLTKWPPVDDELGLILAGVFGAIKGELFNNNIFGGIKECHSHYLDMATSFLAAGGNPEVVKFLTPYGKGTRKYEPYSKCLDYVLSNPLATFILVPAIEKNTPKFFETVSKTLCKESRFDKYRQFVDRHIELDRGEHSSVTLDWLVYYCKKTPQLELTAIESAIHYVINLIMLGKGKSTYEKYISEKYK